MKVEIFLKEILEYIQSGFDDSWDNENETIIIKIVKSKCFVLNDFFLIEYKNVGTYKGPIIYGYSPLIFNHLGEELDGCSVKYTPRLSFANFVVNGNHSKLSFKSVYYWLFKIKKLNDVLK